VILLLLASLLLLVYSVPADAGVPVVAGDPAVVVVALLLL
jgi:hypothetical protein